MDSDGQHSPKDILTQIRPIVEEISDFFICSRHLGNNFYDLPLTTRLGEVTVV